MSIEVIEYIERESIVWCNIDGVSCGVAESDCQHGYKLYDDEGYPMYYSNDTLRLLNKVQNSNLSKYFD